MFNPQVFVQEKWQDLWSKLQLHQLYKLHPVADLEI